MLTWGRLQGIQIKLAHASRGKPDSIDTQTNDSLLAGAEEQSSLVVAQYRVMIKSGRAVADKQDAVIRTGTQVAQQLKTCAELARSPVFVEFMGRFVQHRERECELDALLMNGFSNGLVLALDDYATKKERDMKNSKTRYEQSLGDYGVAVRKAQVRLGKGAEYMNATKYLKAAVGREICLHNYEQVTSEHLAVHRRVEESRNLEVFTEFHRAQEAQIKFAVELEREAASMKAASERALQWAHAENERLAERMREAAKEDTVQEEARMWESHDDFMRFMTQPNVMAAFLKTPEAGPVAGETVLAAAFDSWGLSESLLLDLIARNPQPDDSLPLLAGNKTAERLLQGYVRVHFGEWFAACWQPMVERLNHEPERYALGKPQGMSAALTLTELVIERICDSMDKFPPLFARLCQVPHIVPSLIGGRVFKACLTTPERFGLAKLNEPVRTTAEVMAFLLWEILRGRSFAAIDAVRAQQLKMNLTVAHHVSESVEMLKSWASSPPLQLLRETFTRLARAVEAPQINSSVETKLASVRDGGRVNQLLQACRARQEVLGNILLEMDRAVFFKFCDLFQKASVASLRGKREGEASQSLTAGESSAIEDDSGSYTDGVDFKSIIAMSLGSQIEEGGGESGSDEMAQFLAASATGGGGSASSSSSNLTLAVPVASMGRNDSQGRSAMRAAPPSPMARQPGTSSPSPSTTAQYRALVSPRPAPPHSSESADEITMGGRASPRPPPPPVTSGPPAAKPARAKSSDGQLRRPAPPSGKPVAPPPGTNAFSAMRTPQKPIPEVPQQDPDTPPLPPPKKPMK